MQELKLNSNNSASPHRWPAEPYGQDPAPDGYQGSQTFHGAPLTGELSAKQTLYSSKIMPLFLSSFSFL
jgi:E3 SUMO-protein ligase RanBP2